jgi:hypothetical protein
MSMMKRHIISSLAKFKVEIDAKLSGFDQCSASVLLADDPSDTWYLPYLGKLIVLKTMNDWPGIIVPPYFKPDLRILAKVIACCCLSSAASPPLTSLLTIFLFSFRMKY